MTPKEHHRVIANLSNDKLKNTVFSHYCNGHIKCQRCNFNEVFALTMDHINNNGNEHRKKINYCEIDLYRWLKKNNYPNEFQVLCFNCQFRKRQEYNESKRTNSTMINKAKYVTNLKLKCLSHYGEICVCGEKDNAVLTLDHVNNDGANHRKKLNITSGYNFYLFLQKNNFPSDPPLQAMCMNCQFIKRNKIYFSKRPNKLQHLF